MEELELAVFDLAGTTVEDRGQVPEAFISALADQGIVVTPEQVKQVRGASKRQALRQLIPAGTDQESRIAAAYAAFKLYLRNAFASGGVCAIPGAEGTLQVLRQHGVKVAINTGFDRDITELLLEALGWDHGLIDAVICGDEVVQGRPAPYMIFRAMEATATLSTFRVAVVGDTLLDLQAGANAGVRWNIGVLTGAHDRSILEAGPHTHLLASVADMLQIWPDE